MFYLTHVSPHNLRGFSEIMYWSQRKSYALFVHLQCHASMLETHPCFSPFHLSGLVMRLIGLIHGGFVLEPHFWILCNSCHGVLVFSYQTIQNRQQHNRSASRVLTYFLKGILPSRFLSWIKDVVVLRFSAVSYRISPVAFSFRRVYWTSAL